MLEIVHTYHKNNVHYYNSEHDHTDRNRHSGVLFYEQYERRILGHHLLFRLGSGSGRRCGCRCCGIIVRRFLAGFFNAVILGLLVSRCINGLIVTRIAIYSLNRIVLPACEVAVSGYLCDIHGEIELICRRNIADRDHEIVAVLAYRIQGKALARL